VKRVLLLWRSRDLHKGSMDLLFIYCVLSDLWVISSVLEVAVTLFLQWMRLLICILILVKYY
jgi:hypothetical protein